ncbi:MAG: aminodeoxychorismate lyase [Gammaproteobacteria bacterium]
MINILINGEPCDSVSALDRGLHYGDGVFETLKVYRGQIMFLEQHLQRLLQGCERLQIPQPPLEKLIQEANRLTGDEEKAVLKILITRGRGGRGYRMPENAHGNRIVIRYAFPEYSPAKYHRGVVVRLCDLRLSSNAALAGIKHLNRLEQVLARAEWQDESIAEGLMMDTKGNIIEGTMSNVFIVSQNRLLTPDLTSCGVAGIIRQYVLNTAQDLGISHDITEVKKEVLLSADEVFLSNSLIGLWPVRQIVPISKQKDAQTDYKIGPITGQLMQALCREEARQSQTGSMQ